MENCTIYSHVLDFPKVIEIVKTALPKAKIETQDNGQQKSVTATIKGGFFSKNKTLTINYRERTNPSYKLEKAECDLTQNLAGMVNFIQSIPAQNQEIQGKFLTKVMAANCEMGFICEPEINADFKEILRKITLAVNGFIFTSPSDIFNKSQAQHFLDKDLNLILDTFGYSEIADIDVRVDAKYFDADTSTFTTAQTARKAKSEVFLEVNNIKINKNLPCVADDNATELRHPNIVIERAYALLLTAVKGEGIEQEHLERARTDKRIDSLSPRETQVFNATSLDDNERAYATWRYESLYTILWALGCMEELKYPSDICDVKGVVGAIFPLSRADFRQATKLRSKTEILDELDKTYRMNWACVDARIKGQQPTGNINPSVIYERHYALNWLTKYDNQDWDDVQTHT